MARLLFVGLTLFVVFPYNSWKWPVTPWSAALWPEVSDVYWHPVGLFRLLGLRVGDPWLMFTLWIVFYVALLLATVGWHTRKAMALVFVLNLYLTNITHNFGKINWAWELAAVLFVFLALSRCGDAVSVDAWLRRRRGLPPVAPSGEHNWPIKGIWMWISLAYFAAGVSKLRNGGLDWITTDTLGVYMLRANYDRIFVSVDPMTTWGTWFAQQPLLLRGMSIFTLVVEVGFPLAFFSRRLRLFFVPAAIAMHVGIGLLIGALFSQWICAAVFWVQWGRVLDFLQRRRVQPGSTANSG